MTILDEASHRQIGHLLELFPVVHLRQTFTDVPPKLTKRAFCLAVAKNHERAQIVNFVDAHFSCGKQHVYVFSLTEDSKSLPATVAEGDRVKGSHKRALYIAEMVRGVFLTNPVEKTSIKFLWPVLVEMSLSFAVVRFIVLEKNIAAYYAPRGAFAAEHGVTEDAILGSLAGSPLGAAADLNKGIKALWEDDFIDGYLTKYKGPLATTSRAMNDQKGMKKTSAAMYLEAVKGPLRQTTFAIDASHAKAKKLRIKTFSTDPTAGTISFGKYTEKVGDTDYVIREILQNN